MRPKVLFLCTGNSCRSQMAEGWARHLLEDKIEAFSAGTSPQLLNGYAVLVMKEAGVDISNHQPKPLKSLESENFDLVVTVCDEAAQTCPIPPKCARALHVPFEDPPRLAKEAGSEAKSLQLYRRVRDQIKAFVETLPSILTEEVKAELK